MLFHPLVATKAPNMTRVMIVQTHAHDGGNGRGFLFFQQKAVIYTKLLPFLEK